MAQTIYATFPNALMAERAVGALLDHGATLDCLSVVVDARAALTRNDLSTEDIDPVAEARLGITTTTSADAAVGATTGAGLGLGLGTLAALASLLIPGFGFVFGGGALATALGATAGAMAAGALAGGVTGYLKDQGVPGRAAVSYQEDLASGYSILAVAVPCGDLDRITALEMLEKYGAARVANYPVEATVEDVSLRTEASQPLVPEPVEMRVLPSDI